jgi:hypothetical protein
MLLRPLLIDSFARAAIQRVREFAELPENYYRVMADDRATNLPGNDGRYICMLSTYRCVFSITQTREGKFRHLSISVPSANYPHPAAAFMIAKEFGFTGWDGLTYDRVPSSWVSVVSEEEHCLILAQKL